MADVANAAEEAAVNGKRSKAPRNVDYLLVGVVINGTAKHVIGSQKSKGRAMKALADLSGLVGNVYGTINVFKGRWLDGVG